MTKTLNHYNNKRHNRRRNKTQRKNKKKHGGRFRFRPGQVHYFDQTNLDMLDDFMRSKGKTPWVLRHHRATCPHCTDFEGPWSAIESSIRNDPPLYGAASLDNYATDHIAKEYPDYPPVKGVPTVVMIDSNGVPIEHTGPNTLEAIEKFLNEHGLKIAIVPIEPENEPEEEEEEEAEEEEEEQEPRDNGAGLGAGLGAGAGLAASGLAAAAGAEEPENPSTLSKVRNAVSQIDDSIKGGLDKVSDTLTQSINFKNLFSSSDDTTPAAAAPDAAPAAAPDAAPAAESAAAITEGTPAITEGTPAITEGTPAITEGAADAFPPAPPAPPVNEGAADAVDANGKTKDPNAPGAGVGAGVGAAPQLPSNGGKRGKKTRRRRGKKRSTKRRSTKRSKRHTK
jgi:hypothetical protein